MKYPSDIIRRGLNPGVIDLWPTALPVRPWSYYDVFYCSMFSMYNVESLLLSFYVVELNDLLFIHTMLFDGFIPLLESFVTQTNISLDTKLGQSRLPYCK